LTVTAPVNCRFREKADPVVEVVYVLPVNLMEDRSSIRRAVENTTP
jgi:hypothetical protein